MAHSDDDDDMDEEVADEGSSEEDYDEESEEESEEDERDEINMADDLERGYEQEIPLSDAQMEYLKRPAGNFSCEEVYYIFSHEGCGAVASLEKLKFLTKFIGLAAVQDQMVKDLEIITGLRKVASQGNVPDPEDGIYQKHEELNPEKLKWGERIYEVIRGSPLHSQIWIEHLMITIIEAKLDYMLVAKVEAAAIFGPEATAQQKEHAARAAKANLPLVRTDLNMARWVYQMLWERYWENGEVAPKDEAQKLIKEYESRPSVVRDREEGTAIRAKVLEQIAKEIEEAKTAQAEDSENEDDTDSEPGEDGDEEQTDELIRQLVDASSNNSNETQENEGIMSDTKKTVDKLGNKLTKQLEKFSSMNVQFTDDPNAQHIQLPKGMDLETGIYWLGKMKEESERTYQFSYKFKDWYPLDAMWALYRAITKMYGFAHVGDFETFWGDVPPTMLTIDVDFGKTQQIPWGPIEVRGLSGKLTPKFSFHNGLPSLTLNAVIKNNEREQADKLMALAEEFLTTESIYKGKAIEVDFTVFTPDDINFDITKAPKFWDTRIREEDLVLPETVRKLVETNLWTPIRHTQMCVDNNIALRRTNLFAGPYGVGKTLAARVTAMLCKKHGWTFINLKDLNQLPQALYFAKKYEPAVIFAEDINRVFDGDRDAQMDNLLNTIDGIDRKNDKVMLCLTTNDIDDIHAGMMRPGRTDSIVTFTAPDADAVQKLIRLYGRNSDGTHLVDPSADLHKVGLMLAGQIPAIISEAIQRAKLAAISDLTPGGRLVVRSHHLEVAAAQMLEHAKYLAPKPKAKADLQLLGEAFGEVLVDGLREAVWKNTDLTRDAVQDMTNEEVLAKGVREVVLDAGLDEVVVEKNG